MSRARASLFVGLFILISFLGSAQLEAQGEKLGRQPQVLSGQNSQTIELLKGHANLNPGVALGNKIAVVDGSALLATTPINEEAFAELGGTGSAQISTYIVREGDTLGTIAKMFGVSVNTIAWANDIKGGRISLGQSLVILPISGVKHTVVKGDTLQTIAKKYKADIGDLTAYNGLSVNAKLDLGDVVIVPDGEISSIVSSTSSSDSSSSVSVGSGYYMRPLQGGRKTQGIHGHNGVDIAAPMGTTLVAAASGKVLISRSGGWNGGYGVYVVISHSNGTQTLYSHMNSVSVSVGQDVEKGQVIGTVGNTGKSTGPHVHFEIRGARNPF